MWTNENQVHMRLFLSSSSFIRHNQLLVSSFWKHVSATQITGQNIHTTQSLAETLNSDEVLLEVDQKSLEIKKNPYV